MAALRWGRTMVGAIAAAVALAVPALLAVARADDSPVPAAAPAAHAAVGMGGPRPNIGLPARERVAKATNYYCYYETGRAAELSHYDLVILHTPAAKREDVLKLKKLGVVTLGYLTVGADESIRKGDGTGPGGFASWYFDKNHDGKPDCDPTWKTPWANAADPNWRKDRVEQARHLIEDVGFDGVFLDTTDNVTIFPEMFDGMVQLIHQLRTHFPDAPIIMNQSWDLLRTCAPDIDGVMLEGFTTSYDFAAKDYRRNPPNWDDGGLDDVTKRVLPVQREHPFKVVILDYARPDQTARIQEAKDRAATFGFIECTAPVGLDDVYVLDLVGHPNPKWLQRQATPESMGVTLDKEINGFPAGTKVMPSGAFGGYTVAPVVDGISDRSKLDWSKAAWASSEDGDPKWLEVRLPQDATGGKFRIEWEPYHPSQKFVVQTKTAEGPWREAARVTGNVETNNTIALPDQPYRSIRIYQEPGDGSSERPDLMWVEQIRMFSRR